MRLRSLKIKDFKNLTGEDGWFHLDFTNKDGITLLIGNNGSGKSNVLEAISAIFFGLYNKKSINFHYKIEYEIRDKVVEFHTYGMREEINEQMREQYLPSNVLMLYSGDDTKILKQYYEPFAKKFQKSIKEAQTIPSLPKMLYVDKFFWTISLLSLLKSDLKNNEEFCKKILKNDTLENIEILFTFNQILIQQQFSFLNSLSNGEKEKKFTLDEFKFNESIPPEKDLFINLASMVGEKNKIKNLVIKNNEIDTLNLSEGEKKQILIRVALEILGDENTLILMDEPDSHIHVANKIQIKDMLKEYPNRENILTSHSPTLMNIFENHLEYLENGQIKGKEKAEILKEISGDLMSFSEQQIVVNSNSDLLLVEGKTDIEYIKIALNKLSVDYPTLQFEYIPMGGTDSLQHFIEKFTPKENQTILALLDRDDAGKKALKQVFKDDKDIKTFSYEKIQNMYVVVYPKKDDYINDNFLVEDYFETAIINDMAKEIIGKYNDSFKSYPNIAKQIKHDLPIKCKDFPKEKFNGFKKLFDLILDIKKENNSN